MSRKFTKQQLEEVASMEKEGILWKKCGLDFESQFCGLLQRTVKAKICGFRDACPYKLSFSAEEYVEAMESGWEE